MGLTRITSDGITDGTISTADLADQSVTLAKLPHGTSSNNGKFLRANVGADPTFETIDSFGTGSLVGDQAPQLGGDLASNGNNINMADDDIINVGSGNDLRIRHNGLNSLIEDMGTGNLQIRGDDVHITGTNDEILAKFIENTGVELYHDGSSKKFETTSNGVQVSGNLVCGTVTLSGGGLALADDDKVVCGNGDDLEIYHDGTESFIHNNTDDLNIEGDSIKLRSHSGEAYIVCTANNAVQLRYDNSPKFATTNTGTNFNSGTAVFNGPSGTSYTAEFRPINANPYGLACIENSGANAGYPLFAVTSNNGQTYFRTLSGGVSEARNILPAANNTYDLGSSSKRWSNIYTGDLNLSNEGGSNDVDGTWGSYTIQEGAEDLFLVNKRNGKKYKFNLTEVS